MATSTRRRKPAPADAATPELLEPSTESSDSPTPVEPAAAEPEAAEGAAPAKRARAPRKTAAAPRKRRAAPAEAKPEAAEAAEAAEVAVPEQPEAPAAAEAPRPRRRAGRASKAATEAAAVAETEPAPAVADVAPAEPTAEAAVPVESAPLDEPAPDEDEPPAEAVEAPPAPPLPETSRVALEDGLHRRLRWQAGSRCPDTLAQAARRWQRRGTEELGLAHLDELSELLAIAGRTGHTVDIDDEVWAHLARLGDLQGRIAHLESRHPEGLDPAVQPEGSLLAGWRTCQLEAAFFAACAGRCVLADEASLKPEEELLLAARLVMQHFGTHAPVVQAPAEAHVAWQSAWDRLAAADAPAALTLLAPGHPIPAGTELLLLDQRGGLDPAAAESPAAQAAGWLWVLAPDDVLARPEALALFAAVDQLRQGGLATWQAEGDAAALAPVLLARRFADVASQWPAWASSQRTTAATVGEASQRDELARRLERWQRSGFLADSDQLGLRRALHSLWEAARAANVAALPSLLGEALANGAGRIVVFTEDAAALPALAAALQAAGLPAEALPHAGSPRLADQALRAFREAEGPRILLVADGPEGVEPRIGVQLATPLVIHLDTPWPTDALARRLQRVRPGAAQREVPVWQLLPEGSLMARRAHAVAQAAEAASQTRLTGALLRGDTLDAWRAELSALL